MDPQTPGHGSATVRDPIGTHLLVWVGFPVLGGGAGWVLASAADWVAALPWVPFQGPFELVAGFTGPVATLVLVGLGVVAGVAMALTAYGEMLTVTVSNQAVRLTRDNVAQDIDRGVVASVFADGKELVLVGTAGQELAREKSDLSRWVEDAHDLPTGQYWRRAGAAGPG